MPLNELVSIENLIEQAKAKGIDFGKGDPYNRLRYYTKIGWLPHMVRKKDENGFTRGHYPISAIQQLVDIESHKAKGLSNDIISKKIKTRNRFQHLLDFVKSKETRNQLVLYLSFGILMLILFNELGITKFGQSKALWATASITDEPNRVLDSGTAFVPKNQNKLAIQTHSIKSNSKVYITFTQDYSPAARFWVSNIDEYRGFTIELDAPVFNNSEFNWWVTN